MLVRLGCLVVARTVCEPLKKGSSLALGSNGYGYHVFSFNGHDFYFLSFSLAYLLIYPCDLMKIPIFSLNL
ncbi:hypothetical protein COP2_040276 [Malus domestica]